MAKKKRKLVQTPDFVNYRPTTSSLMRPKSQIVFFTADRNKDIMQAALSIAGTRYVLKANAAADLVDAIATALAVRYTAAL